MPYVPNFSADVVAVERVQPVRLTYTGDTTPAVAGYFWDLGDGQTSNLESPEVYWKAVGQKTITLTVVFEDGERRSVTKSNYVAVSEGSRQTYIDLIPTFFRKNAVWSQLLTPFIDQLAMLEFQATKLQRQRSFNGFGDALDVVGEVLGLPRLGLGDTAYANALREMPAINHGCGQLEVLISFTQLFLKPTSLTITQGPMRLTFNAVTDGSVNYDLFVQRLKSRAAAATTIELLVAEETPLEFEESSEPALFSGSEFSEIDDYYDGGILSEEI